MSKEIEKLIVKFLLKEANFDELQQLEFWITNPKNESLFSEYIKTNIYINKVMNQYDKDKAKDAIIRRIRQTKGNVPVYKKPWLKYAAAAIFIIALAMTYFLREEIFNNAIEQTLPTIVINQIEPGIDKATLTLENGENVILEKGSTYKTQNAKSNGEEIVYSKINNTSQESVFNYLTVPRGGQFFIELSDGTKVWLNSETQLKYPVRFAVGKTREVELVYGEAYFDVVHNTEYGGSNFKVINQSQEIEVLGTKFNVKAYKEETNVYTTLVEGKVAINIGDEKQNLEPNLQSNLDILSNIISISKVDVNAEIAWIHGDFIFQHKALHDIMKVLSRWYNVEIEFQNKSLKEVKFNGELSKYQELEDILLLIKNTNNINDFEILNNKIMIK